MFVSRVAFWRLFFKMSRHRASQCVGFVLVRLILLRLDRVHTRLAGLRAVNLRLPVGVLSVASFLFLSLSLFVCFPPGYSRAFGWPGALSFALSSLLSLLLAGR